MAVTLTGAGGLFTKLGHITGIVLNINFARGSNITAPDYLVTIPARVNNLEGDYAGGTVQYGITDGLQNQRAGWQNAQGGFLTNLKSLASSTLIDMVNTDALQKDRTLATAIMALIAQMKSGGDYVDPSTVACAAASAGVNPSPNGTPAIVTSVKDAYGLALQYTLPETLTLLCTGDSFLGTGTLGIEPFRLFGQQAVSDPMSHEWPNNPGGSGCNTTLRAVGNDDNSGGNMLVNGNFETFTNTDVPDNWALLVGTATTHAAASAAQFYTGAKSYSIIGDASTEVAFTQKFNTATSTGLGAGGTPATLSPLTQYAFNCWIRNSVSPAAGVFEMSLIDAIAGTTVTDDASVNNLTTRTLTTISTTWTAVNAVFRTPRILPANGVKLKLRASTAISSGTTTFIDRCSFTPMTNTYPGGVAIAIFSGATALATNDKWTLAVTNTWGGFQREFQRLFKMAGTGGLGLVIPFAGSNNISDSLID